MAMRNKIYGFGIVDKKGKPWWGEACVCKDRTSLDDICYNFNTFGTCPGDEEHNHRIPYRVVRLNFIVAKGGEIK